MQRVLIIEKSSTFRVALSRQLPTERFETQTVATYEEGLSRLQEPGEHFDAVVLGWPSRTASITDELLVLLEKPAYCHAAVIILSEDSDPGQLSWLRQRPGTALLMWEEYREIRAALERVQRTLPDITNEQSSIPGDITDHPGIHILLVDDSPTSRLTYRNLLTDNGYTVELAASVDEGYELAVNGDFDIAIIDYFMPGQTGDCLCRRLRENHATRDMVMSILTGTYLDQVIADSLAAGAVECMFKNEANELFLARVAAMSRAVRTRRSVERERRYLEGILNSVGDGVYGVHNDGRLSFINPVARSILGFSENERLNGLDAHELFHYAGRHGEGYTREQDFLARAYDTGERLDDWQAVFWASDGRCIPVEGTVYPLTVDGRRQGSVVAFRDVTERRLLEDQMRWQANHDALTGLLNRRFFEQELRQECARVERRSCSSALVYLDLDQFKYINDTAGHTAGDELLVTIAQRLASRVRSSDLLARLGGDEFAIILSEIEGEALFDVADAYRQIVAETHFNYAGKPYKITASVGVAAIDPRLPSAGEVMAHADLAAHMAKNQGRNQTHVFGPDDDDRGSMDHELSWSSRLSDALAHDEFELVLQPIVPSNIETTLLEATDVLERWHTLRASLEEADDWQYEALLRLRSTSGEWILPGAFLPAAARFSLMPEIDRWTINAAMRLLAEATANGSQPPSLAVNLSAESLADEGIGDEILELIEHYRIEASRLAFEITETTAVTNLSATRRLIGQLSHAGCRFALDDFGSGFCSFGQLKHLDVDYVKIDGLFIQGLVSDPLDKQVVLAINQIAHALGKRTVAEFVETPEALKLLNQCGVDFVQGHCVAPALEPEDADILPTSTSVAAQTS